MARRQTSKRIGLDLDGVFVNFNDAYCGELMAVEPLPVVPPFDRWCWDQHYFTADALARTDHLWTNDMFWYSMKPLPTVTTRALQLLTHLNEDHQLYFITSRPSCVRDASRMWVESRLGVRNPTVLISHCKEYVAHGLDLDVMIEDKFDNLLDILRLRGHNTKCLLVDQPWNQPTDVGNHPAIQRVPNVEMALEAV